MSEFVARRRRLGAVTVALLCGSLALTGCTKKSSDQTAAIESSDLASSAPASSSAPVVPATSAPAPSASAPTASVSPSASTDLTAPLKAILLQPTDLPDWTSAPTTPDPNSDAESAQLAKCVGQPDTSPDQLADVDSPDYSLGNASISSSASSMKSQTDLATDTAILTSPKVSRCYEALVRSKASTSLPGTTLNSVAVAITPGSAGGPANVVATGAVKVSISQGGQSADVFLNIAFITGPLIEAEVDFENVGAPFPAAIRTAVIAKVAARASGAKPTSTT